MRSIIHIIPDILSYANIKCPKCTVVIICIMRLIKAWILYQAMSHTWMYVDY